MDLYLLCREIPLVHLLERSPDKFGHVGDFPLQALKGLADLSQIDGEPMPRLAADVSWNEVEDWVHTYDVAPEAASAAMDRFKVFDALLISHESRKSMSLLSR